MSSDSTPAAAVKSDLSDLPTLAATICRHHRQVIAANSTALEHAMAAGDALIVAHDKVEHGKWEKWLSGCGLNDRIARRYIQLSKGRSTIEAAKRTRESDLMSMAAALRLLGNKSGSAGKKDQNKAAKPPPGLNSLSWSQASLEERRRFLDAIGLNSLLEAVPPAWRPQFQRHVHHGFDDKISKCLRLALAQHRATNCVTPGVVSALHTLNNLITASGHDLHEIVGLKFNRKLTIERRATAKAA